MVKDGLAMMRASMRISRLAMIAILSLSAARADPAIRPKPDHATPSDPLPPLPRAAGNPCAAFGPGFVQVAGTATCVRVGGAFRADVGGAAGSR